MAQGLIDWIQQKVAAKRYFLIEVVNATIRYREESLQYQIDRLGGFFVSASGNR